MLKRSLMQDLKNWAADPSRKPLLIRGARQVGKTTIIRELGKTSFDNFFEINLEDREVSQNFREPLSLNQFIEVLKLNLKIDVTKPNTLLFIDEIQEIPWILELFRFVYENMPTLALVGSGSLLEVKLSKLRISIPVGRIENRYLYPLTFYEYLDSIEEHELLAYLTKLDFHTNVPDPIHKAALSLFHKYIILGGMPEVINEYIKSKNDTKISSIKNNLLTTYLEDAVKYATKNQQAHIEHVLENAPSYAGVRFNYAKFANSKYGSEQMKTAFNLLSNAMLLHQVECTDRAEIPLIAQSKRQKKLIYFDVGLVSQSFGLNLASPKFADLNDLFRGQIAEQVVGQHLYSSMNEIRLNLHYWSKQTTEGSAEVDFLVQNKTNLIAIEVKSGVSGRLKSLLSLSSSFPKTILVRIYSGPLKIENMSGNRMYSLPFYLIERIKEIVH